MNINNAGDFKHKIEIYSVTIGKDSSGFMTETETLVLAPYARVKTTKGFTLILNNSDFEKALTNFTIRYPITPINRDMIIRYRGKKYEILYLNNMDEANTLLEIQAKEVTH
jgi:SPP1 family predicted phage head-tail adaptor